MQFSMYIIQHICMPKNPAVFAQFCKSFCKILFIKTRQNKYFAELFFQCTADEAFHASFLAFLPDFLQPHLIDGLSFSIIHKKFKY
nr:MAG TPA: hypothetical protein [Caudoviricetes sp.]